MKHPPLLDKAIVAALLLVYVPGLIPEELPAPDPIALIAPASATQESTEENPADRL